MSSHTLKAIYVQSIYIKFLYFLERCFDGLLRPKHVAVLDKGSTVIGWTLERSVLSILKHSGRTALNKTINNCMLSDKVNWHDIDIITIFINRKSDLFYLLCTAFCVLQLPNTMYWYIFCVLKGTLSDKLYSTKRPL